MSKVKFMKTIAIMLFMVSFQSLAQEAKQTSEDQTTYIKMSVDGLACPFCAYGLEKKVKKIKGVKDIFIEINEGYITFNIPKEKSPTEETLLKIVKEAGFKAREINYSKIPFTNSDDSK